MSTVKLNVPSLLQGMSQRDARLRRETEAELQVNCVSDTTHGLGHRPGTQHIAELGGVLATPLIWDHWVDRDDEEKYVFLFDGQNLRVFNIVDRSFEVVQADASALSYLVSSEPTTDLFGLTILDTTFIVNRRKTAAMSSYTTPAVTPRALVWVRAGNYRTEYIITLDGTDYSFETPKSSVTDADAEIQTNNIASELETALAAASGFAVTRDENVLLIEKTDGSDFTISVNDSVADSQLGLSKDEVSRFSLLPPRAPHGHIVRVVGLDTAGEDDYWVQFVAENPLDTVSSGRWEETVAPGTQSRYDAATMPHKLERLQDDSGGTVTGTPYKPYFRLAQVDWLDAVAGDDTSNPPPSFIGQPIDSLFLLDNRLGFLSGSQIVLSQTGDFVQLRRTTVQSLAPDDRIDVTAGDGRVVNLRYAVSLSEQLLLSGDNAVMAIPTDTAVEPASFRVTTAYSARLSDSAPPLVVGRSLFLPVNNGVYSDVREASASGVDRIKDAALASSGVSELIQGDIVRWDADDTGPSLYIKSNGASRRVYVYKWLDGDDSRIQSAWGYWLFDDAVLSLKVIRKQLWLLMSRPDGVSLEVMDLDPARPQTGQYIPFRLDRYAVLTIPAAQAEEDTDPDGGGGGGGGSGGGLSGGPGGSQSGPGLPVDDPDAETPGSGGFAIGGALPSDGIGIQSYVEPVTPTSPYTELELPYEPFGGMRVVRADTLEELTWETTTDPRTIKIIGNVGALPIVVGQTYSSHYTFSPAHARQNTPAGGRQVMIGDRTQVLRLRVECSECPEVYADVYDDRVYAFTETFNPLDFGGNPAAQPWASGTFSIPIRMRNTRARVRLRSGSYLPAWFISAQWEVQLMTYGAQL